MRVILTNILHTCIIIITSAKIIQLNEWGCRDGMHRAKNRRNKVIPLAILSSYNVIERVYMFYIET